MANQVQLGKKELMRKFKKIMKNLSEKLDKYIEEATEDNIHDLRVSIRRLESAYRVLPRKIRMRQEVRHYVIESKSLFKINAMIRDFDIIVGKLGVYNSSQLEIINSIKRRRTKELANAHLIALKLRQTQIPKLKVKELNPAKIRKRVRKIIDRLSNQITKNIPVVISDEKKILELHKLRKDFKKFRYSLEFISEDQSIKSLESLKRIQDLLGEIHDSDIMLNYLEKNNYKESSNITRNEILVRGKKYQQFVKLVRMEGFDAKKFLLQLKY